MLDGYESQDAEIIGQGDDVIEGSEPGASQSLPAHLQGKSATEIASYYEGRLSSEREARENLLDELQGGRRSKQEDDEPEPVEREEEEYDLSELDNIDIVDLLAEKGAKGLLEVLKKAGVVTGKDVKKAIRGEFGQLEQAYTLQQEFPDLADPNSEFSRTAQKHLKSINKDPDFKNLPVSKKFKLAAREAEAELGSKAAARPRRGQQQEEELEEDDYMMVGSNPREDSRSRRIARQSGARTSRTSREMNPESDELSREQKIICAKLGIKEENYKARAKKGVTIHRRR